MMLLQRFIFYHNSCWTKSINQQKQVQSECMEKEQITTEQEEKLSTQDKLSQNPVSSKQQSIISPAEDISKNNSINEINSTSGCIVVLHPQQEQHGEQIIYSLLQTNNLTDQPLQEDKQNVNRSQGKSSQKMSIQLILRTEGQQKAQIKSQKTSQVGNIPEKKLALQREEEDDNTHTDDPANLDKQSLKRMEEEINVLRIENQRILVENALYKDSSKKTTDLFKENQTKDEEMNNTAISQILQKYKISIDEKVQKLPLSERIKRKMEILNQYTFQQKKDKEDNIVQLQKSVSKIEKLNQDHHSQTTNLKEKYELQLTDLKNECESLKKSKQDDKDTWNRCKNDYQIDLAARQTKYTEQKQIQEQKMKQIQKQIDNLRQQKSRLQETTANYQNQLNSLADQMKNKQNQIMQLKSSIETQKTSHKETLAKLKTDIKILNQSVTTYKNEVNVLNDANESLQTKYKSQLAKLQKANNSQIQKLSAQRQQLIEDHKIQNKKQQDAYRVQINTITEELQAKSQSAFRNYKQYHQKQRQKWEAEAAQMKKQMQKSQGQLANSNQQLNGCKLKLKFTEQSLERANESKKQLEIKYAQKEAEVKNELKRFKDIETFIRQQTNQQYQQTIQKLKNDHESELNAQKLQNQQLLKAQIQKNRKEIEQMNKAYENEVYVFHQKNNQIKFQQISSNVRYLTSQIQVLQSDLKKNTQSTHQIMTYFMNKESEQTQLQEKREKDLLANCERYMLMGIMKQEEKLRYLTTLKESSQQLEVMRIQLGNSFAVIFKESKEVERLNHQLTFSKENVKLLQQKLQQESKNRDTDMTEIKKYYQDRLKSESQRSTASTAELISHYQLLLASKNNDLSKTATYYTNQLNQLKQNSKINLQMQQLKETSLNNRIKTYEVRIRMMEEDHTEEIREKDQQIRILNTEVATKKQELADSQKIVQDKTERISQFEENIKTSLQAIMNFEEKSQIESLDKLLESFDTVSHPELAQSLKSLITSLSNRQDIMKQQLSDATSKVAELISTLAQLVKVKDNYEADISRMSSQLAANKTMFNSLSARHSLLQAEKIEQASVRQHLQNDLRQANQQLESSKLCISNLKTELTTKNDEIDGLKTTNLQLTDTQQQLEQTTTLLNSLQSNNTELLANLQNQITKNTDLQSNIQQLNAQIAEMTTKMEIQAQKMRNQQQERPSAQDPNLLALQQQVERLQTEKSNLSILLSEANTAKQTSQTELTTLKSKLSQLESQKPPTLQDLPTNHPNYKQMQAQLEQLTKSQNNLQNELKKLKTSSNDNEELEYNKQILSIKEEEVVQLTADRDRCMQEINHLKQKLKNCEENSRNIGPPLSPRASRSPPTLNSLKQERSPIKELKIEQPLHKADTLLTPYPESSKNLFQKLKTLTKKEVLSIDLIHKMTETKNFTALFSKDELFAQSFLFLFITKSNRTFGIALFRQFMKPKHSALLFCLNPQLIIEKKPLVEIVGSVAKLEVGELVFDNGLFRIKSGSTVLQFKESNAKYFGKFSKTDLFGAAYYQETMGLELTQFEIHRINFK